MSGRGGFFRSPIVWFTIVGIAAITAYQLVCRRTPSPPPVLLTLPAFSLVDQDGEPFDNASLGGKTWVVNFFFTSCPSICPDLMRKMGKLQSWYDEQAVEGGSLLSISVDPERDTPERLREYAASLGVDPARWTLVTGDPDEVRRLVVGGFKTALDPSSVDDGMIDITHSGKFVLVDGDGGIRGYYDSDDLGLDEIFFRSIHVRDARVRRSAGCYDPDFDSREGIVAVLDRPGLLLVNLGTPKAPTSAALRPYLREFLLDRRVIDVPALQRNAIVRLFILPFRPRKSAEAYGKIWTAEGSPLLVHSKALRDKGRSRLGDGVVVELAMRYGSPSIGEALSSLRARGVDRIVVFPLYPQYSSAATGSTTEAAYREAGRLWNTPYLQIIPPFFHHAGYLDAVSGAARPVIDRVRPEKVFFSFHGVPERQIVKGDDAPGGRCLRRDDCCDHLTDVNRNCYRAQCFATARALADRLGLGPDQAVVCFQSRLGRTPWIRPYTDEVLAEHARAGVRRAVILSPAFVADCLETLEELGMRGAETWREHGGETLALAPCPNADDTWADAVAGIAREQSAWIRDAAP